MKAKKRMTGLAIVFATFLLFPIDSIGQNNWGLGIRLGDPSGITIKKYMDETALELSIGRTHWLYGHRWYDKRFDNWYHNQKFGYKDFQYIGYKASVPVGFQLHYLIHKGFNKVSDEDFGGLKFYFGFGAQMRFQTFTYDYRYKLEGSPDWYHASGEKVTDFDIGVDGVIGLEYTFDEVPVSMFIDATLFMEVADNPFLFWGQGGLGVRYNF